MSYTAYCPVPGTKNWKQKTGNGEPVWIETILWKHPIDILTMGDSLANAGAIFLVDGNANSETANPNFLLIGISSHALKVS